MLSINAAHKSLRSQMQMKKIGIISGTALTGVLMLVASFAIPSMVGAANSAELSRCTSKSRECLIATAMSWIDAVTSRDPSRARFSSDARMTVEGTMDGAAGGVLFVSKRDEQLIKQLEALRGT